MRFRVDGMVGRGLREYLLDAEVWKNTTNRPRPADHQWPWQGGPHTVPEVASV
jgi:hypothetical protein